MRQEVSGAAIAEAVNVHFRVRPTSRDPDDETKHRMRHPSPAKNRLTPECPSWQTKTPTVEDLDNLGRERLSKNFYMREFLHSEVAARFNVVNYPDEPEVALQTGRLLCDTLLEPLQDKFGRISIRSGFRSSTLNSLCHEKGFNCAENSKAYGRHIWDVPSEKYGYGAMACVVIPSVHDAVCGGIAIDEFACWVDSNLPYCFVSVFQNQTAINICCSEKPKKDIYSRIEPSGLLFRSGEYVGKNLESPSSEKLAVYVSNWRRKGV